MDNSNRTSRRWTFVLLLLAIGVGGWLRMRGIGWGLPESYYFDEEHFVKRSLAFGTGDLNPHWFHKPAFFMYVLFFEYGLYYLVGSLAGVFESTEEFAVSFFLDPGPFYRIGRVTVCVFGTATILLVYRLGAWLRGPGCGLVAAWVFALNAASVAASKVVKADVPSAFFAVLSLVLLVAFLRRANSSRVLEAGAGFFAGLGTAAKYYPMVLALPLLLASILHARRRGEPVVSAKRLLGSLCLGLGFFLGSPYNFLDSTWIRETVVQRILPAFGQGEIVADDATYQGAGMGQAIVDFIAVVIAPEGMGIGFGAVALLGLLVMAIRGKGAEWLLVSTFAFFAGMCVVFNPSYAESRHLLIVFPVLAVALGFLAEAAIGVAQNRGRRSLGVGGVGAILVIGGSLAMMDVIRQSSYLMVPDVRNLARRWFEQNVPPGTKVLVDENHVKLQSLASTLREELALAETLAKDDEDQAFTQHLPEYYRYRLMAAERDPSPRFDVLRFYHPWWKRSQNDGDEGEVRYLQGQDRRMGNPLLRRGVGDLDSYLRGGYRIVVTNSGVYPRYFEEPMASDFPSFHRFYKRMVERLELWKEFRDVRNPSVHIQIFRVPGFLIDEPGSGP